MRDTSGALSPGPTGLDLLGLLAGPDAEQARALVEAGVAPNTRRTYRAAWNRWASWCAERGMSPLPATPADVLLYLAASSTELRPSSLRVQAAALASLHKAKGYGSPCADPAVRALLRGAARLRSAPPKEARPLLLAELLAGLPSGDGARARRDRALLLVGFAGGFRRSELAGLDWTDLEPHRAGLILRLRRSKTDQEGAGRMIGLPYGRPESCPVLALARWREVTGAELGPVWRSVDRWGHLGGPLSDRAVWSLVREAARRAGLDAQGYSAHSLRAGLATSAAELGASERDISAQTGHRSGTVRRYIRRGELFHGANVAGRLL